MSHVNEGDWRPLRLKRNGVCAVCDVALPAGTTAVWSRARSAVRCTSHPVSSPETMPATAVEQSAQPSRGEQDPSAPRVTGSAGGSAQAEYERRKARREGRVRDAHPVLGGLMLALSDEPQHVRAWATGAAGERAVARRLDQLPEHGVEVLHDRRIPGSKANIDHMAVSSSGVYVIDAKNYTGAVRVISEGGLFSPRRSKLLVGRRDATKLVEGVQRQVELVRSALAEGAESGIDVPVTGVLAFFDADWPLFPPDQINGVRLTGPKSTAQLVRRPGTCTPLQIAGVAERLRAHFPEA